MATQNRCRNDEFTKSDIFQWDVVENCNNLNIFECAKLMSQLVFNFNGASNFVYSLIKEHKECDEKIRKLEEQSRRLEKCKNCAVLKKKLDDHNDKMQVLVQVFGQLTNTSEKPQIKSKYDRVHDMFTEMIDEMSQCHTKEDPQESISTKRKLEATKENIIDVPKPNVDVVGYETPKKRIKIEKQSPMSSNVKNETEELLSSPIIGKSKRNITSNFGESKSPLSNLSNRMADKINTIASKSPARIVNDTNFGKESSPSLLGHLPDNEKTPSPDCLNKMTKENGSSSEKRRSLSLLKAEKVTNNPEKSKSKRSPKSKKLKQARLTFSKSKSREPLDVSMSDQFCGGMRSVDVDGGVPDEDEMLRIALQLSLKESKMQEMVTEDEDVIDASPANQSKPSVKHKTHKVQVHRSALPDKKYVEGDNQCLVSDDNDETMILDSQPSIPKVSPSKRRRHQSRGNISSPSKKNETKLSNNSPKKLTRSNCNVEFAHVEPVVRKKVEKKNLEGWGCNKCKEFYEVAFEGNEKVIKEKMNECSRHRGKFDPIRMDTPAGFWDLKMPPTQDTEAFNKRNNRS